MRTPVCSPSTPVSCFVLSNDHIGFLVNLGQALGIQGVCINDSYRPLALYDEHDRRYATIELLTANRTSVASRYNEHVDPLIEVPIVCSSFVALSTLAQIAQAMQWVRCYQYQSCDDQRWNTTFAFYYSERLLADLQSKFIACFTTTWTYDGPSLTTMPAPPR